MMKIDTVVFDGKTFKLAIPVYLSDDEVQSERATALANALFVFNIIQQQIEQLMEDRGEEKCQPKDDTSHPFADDVLMGGD